MSIESVTSETSVGTVNLSRTGFGRHAILGEHDAFPERYRLYESPDELLQDFSEDSAEYRAGRKALIQEPSVSDVAILRRDASANVAQIDTGVIDDASLADGDPLGVEFERRTLEITYDQARRTPMRRLNRWLTPSTPRTGPSPRPQQGHSESMTSRQIFRASRLR